MIAPDPAPKARKKGSRFVNRMYLMRMLGTLLCFFPILSVLNQHGASLPVICLLVANAFVWPHVALLKARFSRSPVNSEKQNLVIDAAAGGFWIAMMALSPLPSVAIVTILISDRLAAGGKPLMIKAMLAMVVTFLLTWLSHGMPFESAVSTRTMYATLPLISVYTIALSMLTASIAVKLREKSRELESIAMMDPLLGIANRRLLEKKIDNELARLRSACGSSALMFIDIDNFKEVNDRFGHKVGDSILMAVSDVLRVVTRSTDTPARLGGDEFVVLMPITTLEEAEGIAQRILLESINVRVLPEKNAYCTLSIGIACATKEMPDAVEWLKAADDALYNAKRAGKNRIFAS
ncbi:diguanylate cyclase [Cedecea davisae]|uniref:diguanylate cyclase n=1 Tax=Cedecea davisae TaxID=158484 RepID=UPI00376ECAD3